MQKFLLFIFIWNSFLFTPCKSYSAKFHKIFVSSATSTTSLSAMGSDQLYRPEDEDSPEFREYLKTLLKMQANRAQTGFAAPSSGSSDAYTAKLTRLKVEQIARRKAGLRELTADEVDASYKEADFKNAA